MAEGAGRSLDEVTAGRYRTLRRLGGGATADVDLVEETESGILWAAKRHRLADAPDWKTWELVERGARVQRTLDHPGVPRLRELVRDESETGATLWIVEEYVAGTDLRRLVRDGGPLSVRRAAGIARGLLAVLDHLHAESPPVVHRDVKPSNVVLRPDGTVALVDFGAVRQALLSEALGGDTVVGTFGYMPPEQYMGRAEPASDLYAAGGTLLFLVTGREPGDFPVRDLRLDLDVALPGRPRLAAVLRRLLEPRIEDRIATAREAIEALAPFERPRSAAAGEAPRREPPTGRRAPSGPASGLVCPDCRLPLETLEDVAGGSALEGCPACRGVWVDAGGLERLTPRPYVRSSDLPRIAKEIARLRPVRDRVVHRPCPRCGLMMTRRNFAPLARIVVDECRPHGLWLDRGELPAIRRFVAAGGLDLSDLLRLP